LTDPLFDFDVQTLAKFKQTTLLRVAKFQTFETTILEVQSERVRRLALVFLENLRYKILKESKAGQWGEAGKRLGALGVDILSAFPKGTYTTLEGTSMAGPHVVGVVALMWSAQPKLIGDIEQTQQILDETAQPYTGPQDSCSAGGTPNNTSGYGIVDAYAAVKAALAIK
jgi:hypothetical protein